MSRPLELPDLTLPTRDLSTVRLVLNAFLRQQLKDLHSVPVSWLSLPTRSLYTQTLLLIAPMLKTDPRPVVAALKQPTLGALIGAWRHELHPGGNHVLLDRLVRELSLLLLLELAASNTLPATGVHVSRGPFPVLRHIGLNLEVELAETVKSLVFLPGRVEALTAEGTHTLSLKSPEEGPWTLRRPYHRIVDGIFLALGDNNPLSHFEVHPDKQGNTLDLGGHEVEEWLLSLRHAFELVDTHLPLIGEEMRLIQRLIVPVGFDAQKHLSASYQEAIGLIYMTLHPNEMTMVEALIHEFQHNKLNAALALDPLLENAFFPLFSSPVRPDPRPLHGVMLAVHAFQPVAKLYEMMNASGHLHASHAAWQKRFLDIIRMNRAGAKTVLDNARPTLSGASFFKEMRSLDEALGALESRLFPEAAHTPVQALPE